MNKEQKKQAIGLLNEGKRPVQIARIMELSLRDVRKTLIEEVGIEKLRQKVNELKPDRVLMMTKRILEDRSLTPEKLDEFIKIFETTLAILKETKDGMLREG